MIQKSACSSHSDNEGWKENLDQIYQKWRES
jgi:hypothetical protein